MLEKDDSAATLLAGKHATESVMRNGMVRTITRGRKGSTHGPEQHKSEAKSLDAQLDGCSSALALEQRMKALDGANEIRLERAQVRRELWSLERDFDEFLDETPACCMKVPVVKMLMWLPGLGRVKAKELLSCLGTDDRPFSEDTRLSELDARSKYVLSERVERLLDRYRRTYLVAA